MVSSKRVIFIGASILASVDATTTVLRGATTVTDSTQPTTDNVPAISNTDNDKSTTIEVISIDNNDNTKESTVIDNSTESKQKTKQVKVQSKPSNSRLRMFGAAVAGASLVVGGLAYTHPQAVTQLSNQVMNGVSSNLTPIANGLSSNLASAYGTVAYDFLHFQSPQDIAKRTAAVNEIQSRIDEMTNAQDKWMTYEKADPSNPLYSTYQKYESEKLQSLQADLINKRQEFEVKKLEMQKVEREEMVQIIANDYKNTLFSEFKTLSDSTNEETFKEVESDLLKYSNAIYDKFRISEELKEYDYGSQLFEGGRKSWTQPIQSGKGWTKATLSGAEHERIEKIVTDLKAQQIENDKLIDSVKPHLYQTIDGLYSTTTLWDNTDQLLSSVFAKRTEHKKELDNLNKEIMRTKGSADYTELQIWKDWERSINKLVDEKNKLTV